MLELILTGVTLKGALALLILVVAVYSFISEKLPPDVTALLTIIDLLLTGVRTLAEAFAGFSHPVTISVAAVMALSAASSGPGLSPL